MVGRSTYVPVPPRVADVLQGELLGKLLNVAPKLTAPAT